jgi:hypothetical protein
MNPIKPNPSDHILPIGFNQIIYAKEQPEYLPLPSIRTLDGKVLTSWKPTEKELELLNSGSSVTIVLFTFGLPLQPILVEVGGINLT